MECHDTNESEELIVNNMGLVFHIANKYRGTGIDAEELISLGTLGLVKAAGHYDAGKGYRFSTFACRCIENEIRMELRRQKRRKWVEVSLDAPVSKAGQEDAPILADILCIGTDNVGARLERRQGKDRVYAAIRQLGEREKAIIQMRFGFAWNEPCTQAEIAAKLGISSQSYISRLESKAMRKLRKILGHE